MTVKIVIEIHSGLVTSASSSAPDIEVVVLDHDILDVDDNQYRQEMIDNGVAEPDGEYDLKVRADNYPFTIL